MLSWFSKVRYKSITINLSVSCWAVSARERKYHVQYLYNALSLRNYLLVTTKVTTSTKLNNYKCWSQSPEIISVSISKGQGEYILIILSAFLTLLTYILFSGLEVAERGPYLSPQVSNSEYQSHPLLHQFNFFGSLSVISIFMIFS